MPVCVQWTRLLWCRRRVHVLEELAGLRLRRAYVGERLTISSVRWVVTWRVRLVCTGTCEFGIAWATDSSFDPHYYAECSAKGICDRETGECVCFDGYTGAACKRSTLDSGVAVDLSSYAT